MQFLFEYYVTDILFSLKHKLQQSPTLVKSCPQLRALSIQSTHAHKCKCTSIQTNTCKHSQTLRHTYTYRIGISFLTNSECMEIFKNLYMLSI